MPQDDTVITNLRKRPRGTWNSDERAEYYRELRWQRVMRIVERIGWACVAIGAGLLGLPVPM